MMRIRDIIVISIVAKVTVCNEIIYIIYKILKETGSKIDPCGTPL